MQIITLLTDFGSLYPAQMKGVILSKVQDITFVDIAHEIPPQDIRAGAFALLCTARYFPPGTIHLAVVDPGVGTGRLGIVVKSGGHTFVGPDNGLLLPAARALGSPEAYMIALSFEAAPTFHGRDVFAPVAAALACGRSPESIGLEVRPVELSFGSARHTDSGIEAEVIYVDRFGNLILNMQELPDREVALKGVRLRPARTYGEAERIEPLITMGSHGFAEIAVNQGNAAEAFGLGAGDRIILEEISCSE
jgi:S-adenosylmethionine hydrolase